MALSKQSEAPAPSVNDYDADTQEILRDMQKEGFDVGVTGLESTPAQSTPVRTPAPAVTPEPDVEPAIEPDNEPESNDGVPVTTPEGRTPTTTPPSSLAEAKRDEYWKEKANDFEGKLGEALQKIADYEKSQQFASVDTKINDVAKKYNVNPAVIKEILTIGSEAFVPPEFRQAITDIQAERAGERVWEAKFDEFDKEFAQGVYPALIAENPSITQAEINKVWSLLGGGDRNGAAWSDDNANVPLLSLYYSTVKQTQRQASGESTRVRGRVPTGGAPAATSKPLHEITPGEISGMTDEQFDTYSEGLRTVK